MRWRYPILFTLWLATAAAESPEPVEIRRAASKSVALLQHTGKVWYQQMACLSCHHQALPAMVFKLAGERGTPLDQDIQRQNATRMFRFPLSLDRAVEHSYLIDPPLDYGMSLVAAHHSGVPPSPSTAAYARLIANRQQADGSWITPDVRPPQAHSRFTATAIGLRALQHCMPPQLQAEMRERVSRAR